MQHLHCCLPSKVIAERLETPTKLHLLARKDDSKHIISCLIVLLVRYRVTRSVRTPLSQFGENLPLGIKKCHIHIFFKKLSLDNTFSSETISQVFYPSVHLSSLIPEWWVQLSVRQQTSLQTGEELEEVSPFREVQRRPLDAILAHQNHRPTTVHWKDISD